MPEITIDVVEIFGFQGDHQSQGSVVLADVYSPDGSKNLYLDKAGRLTGIAGYARQNAAAVTTNTGGSTATFRSLFPYRATSGGSITRQLLAILDDEVNEWEIWKSTDLGVTWTFVSDRGATPVGQLPDWAISGVNLYITVPKTEIPRVWDGASLNAAGSARLAKPTVTAGGTGVKTGTYQWRVVPVIAATGLEKAGSVVSDVLNLVAQSAGLTWTADADTNVGGYNIYSTPGTGKIFYLEGFVSGRTTVAYTSNVADLALVQNSSLTYHGDAPQSGVYFCEMHKQRMWWGVTDADPRKWWQADPGRPDSVSPFAFIDFTDASSLGDVSTGGTGDYDGMFICWMERSVHRVSGTGEVSGAVIDWNPKRSNAQTGTVHHRSVLRVPAGAKYTDIDGNLHATDKVTLAYYTPLHDIRLFDGDNDTIISHAKRDDLALLNYAHRRKVHACIDTALGLALWMQPSNSSTECDTLIVWDFNKGTWHAFAPTPFSSLVEIETSSVAQMVLAAEANIAKGGFVYQWKSGSSFDGSSITHQLMTKALFPRGSDPNGGPASLSMLSNHADLIRRKRFRFLTAYFAKDSSPATVTIDVLPYDATPDDMAVFSLTASGSGLQRKQIINPADGRFFHHMGIRLRITSSGTIGPFTLDALALAFQVLPGLSRSGTS